MFWHWFPRYGCGNCEYLAKKFPSLIFPVCVNCSFDQSSLKFLAQSLEMFLSKFLKTCEFVHFSKIVPSPKSFYGHQENSYGNFAQKFDKILFFERFSNFFNKKLVWARKLHFWKKWSRSRILCLNPERKYIYFFKYFTFFCQMLPPDM